MLKEQNNSKDQTIIDLNLLQSFQEFTFGLKKNDFLQHISFSGCSFNNILIVDLITKLSQNNSLKSIDFSGCNLNSFCISYIFKTLAYNKSLEGINFFNNQQMTELNVDDLIKYVICNEESNVNDINISHCNLNQFSI